jgi:hypothetical protein
VKDLAAFSSDELLAEIVRRRNAKASRRPIVRCDQCQHFKTSETADDKYNPCSKKHVMSFRMPEHETDDDYGFYRRVCEDRAMQ